LDKSATDDPYPAGSAAGFFGFLFLGDLDLTQWLDATLSIQSQDLGFYLGSGIALLGLLLLSALISGSEVAFFSLSPTQLNELQLSSHTADHLMLRLLSHPKRLLATILIFNNLVNIAFVTLSTFVTWRFVGSRTTEGVVITALTFVVTFLIVFFGEVVPKVYANQNNLQFARSTGPLLRLGSKLFYPLSALLLSVSNVIEKRVARRGYAITVDHLNHALELTTATEETTEEERGILKGIVNFGTLTVKQVMRARLDITAVDIELDFHELMDRINKSGYSRIPVFRETIDNLAGLLYVKDLLPYLNEDEHFTWQTLLRPAFFVPETKKIDTLLKDFQEKRIHIAIVVDEYGGTSGLITLEDIIEEIVGEINDEFDEEDIVYNKLDENTYIFEGKTSLNDFCKVVNEDPALFEPVKGESESLGGLLLELNSKLPRVGERIGYNRFVFTVVSADPKRIKRIRVLRKPLPVDLSTDSLKP
jgi:putative hemolysin